MTTINHRPVADRGMPSPPATPDAAPGPPPVELGQPVVTSGPPVATSGPPVVTSGPPVAMPPPTAYVSPAVPAPGSHSVLGRIAMWTVLLALGLLAVVDAVGADVPASAYFATALAVIGAALVVGFRYGRARWLIAVGAVLVVVLGIVAAAEHVGSGSSAVTWKPTSVSQLTGSYEINVGEATLDLSAVDFTGQSVSVSVHVGMGDLTVILPSTVDTNTQARVSVGDATVFGQQWSGIDGSEHTVTDTGSDGVGGGDLALRATVDVGNLEVRR